MANNITDKIFWTNYWSDDLYGLIIKHKPYFSYLLKSVIKKYNVNSFIEIGGFPGTYPYYLKKTVGLKTALLDFIIDRKVIGRVANFYKQKVKSVNLIKADVFKIKPIIKYDMVFSSGFVEHFKDPKKVIVKHLDLVSSGGVALMTIPNYLGLNGILQKKYSLASYQTHNLKVMDINYLTNILRSLKVKNFTIFRYGNSGVWFSNLSNRPLYLKLLVYFFYGLKFPLKLFNINSKLLSPYLIVLIEK